MSEIRTRTRGSTLTTWPLLKIKFCYWYYWMKLLWFRANSRAQWLWLCHPSFSLGFIFQAYHVPCACFFQNLYDLNTLLCDCQTLWWFSYGVIRCSNVCIWFQKCYMMFIFRFLAAVCNNLGVEHHQHQGEMFRGIVDITIV